MGKLIEINQTVEENTREFLSKIVTDLSKLYKVKIYFIIGLFST